MFNWLDLVEVFCGGQVVFFIEFDVFGFWMEDLDKFVVKGKVGYMLLLELFGFVGWGYGFVVFKSGVKDDCMCKVVGDFVGWVMLKEMEQYCFVDGVVFDIGCKLMFQSDVFKKVVLVEYIDVFLVIGLCIKLLIMVSFVWLEIGDNLGFVLEEIFIGMKKDIQQLFDDVVFQVEDVFCCVK